MSDKRSRPIAWHAVVLGFLLAIAFAASASRLQQLRDEWNAAVSIDDYRRVSTRLIDYRHAERFAKTGEIDYMIATSLCRIPARRRDGEGHFNWILANYGVGPQDWDKVVAERAKCAARDTSHHPPQLAFAMLPGQGGSSDVRTKLYYWVGREEAAINTEPVEVVDPKSSQELLDRLYLPSARDAAAQATQVRVGTGYKVLATDNYVLASASGHSDFELREIAKNLERFMAFYVEAFRMRYPSHLVTIYLVPDTAVMRDLALELHGIKVPKHSIGYAFRDDLSILAVIRGNAIGTLAHELFHVMVRDRYGDIPPWLEEGTASLYEVSNISGKYLPDGRVEAPDSGPPLVGRELAVRGTPNWRGCVIKKLWMEQQGPVAVERPTLSQLAGMDWRAFNNLGTDEFVAQQAMNHATARYFMLYLQNEGKLFDVFADFAGRDPFTIEVRPDVDARQRLVAHLGNLQDADSTFEQWLLDRVAPEPCT